MTKLPADVRLQVAQITNKDVWKIEELLQIIKEEVEATELSEGMKICESRVSENTHRRTSVPTTSALLVHDGNPSCKILYVYCKAEHYSASCETVNTIPARMEALKKGVVVSFVWQLVTICMLPSAAVEDAVVSVTESIISHCVIRTSITKKQGLTVKGTVVKIQQ